MFTSGSIYYNDKNFVNIFSNYSDVHVGLPPPMMGEHFCHAQYTIGNVIKSIDVYAVEKVIKTHLNSKIREIDLHNVHFSEDHLRDIEIMESILRNYNIQFEFRADLKETKYLDEIKKSVARDVQAYGKMHAKKIIPRQDLFSEEIIPVTKIEYSDSKRKKPLLESGKADFNKHCAFYANLDFSTGCVTGWRKGTYQTLIPSFNAQTETFTGFYSDKYSECPHCYKLYDHNLFPKTIKDVKGRKDELIYTINTGDFTNFFGKIYGKKVNVIRGGKSTEIGSEYTMPHFIAAVEACLETGTHFVVPTKYLSFDKALIPLLKNKWIHLLHSVGPMFPYETGANRDGKTQQFRLDTARRYREAGVDSRFFMMTDFRYGFQDVNREIKAFAEKHHIPIIALQEIVSNRAVAIPMTGRTWQQLKEPWGHLSNDGKVIGGYKKNGNTGLIPTGLDIELVRMLGKNDNEMFSGCGHTEGTEGITYCGGCGFRRGFVAKTEKPSAIDYDSYKGLNVNDAFDKFKDDTKSKVKKKKRRKKVSGNMKLDFSDD
jgi:hypothetical protein